MQPPLSRLVYVSASFVPTNDSTKRHILLQSRLRNQANGISGFLWCENGKFAQYIEGSKNAVAETFHRIFIDNRHHSLAIIDRSSIAERLFPDWHMASAGSFETSIEVVKRIHRYLSLSDAQVVNAFADVTVTARRKPKCLTT